MKNSNYDDNIFFPDPRPNESDECDSNKDSNTMTHLNDVSRMSSYPHGTPVSRIFFPQCEADVMDILQAAHSAGKKIGIRGTKHSMGGHSIVSQYGWEIDCKYLCHIKYNEKEPNVVRCGPGCQWSDLIKFLNLHGKSPRTMQSYSSFSVGGTLAVNAHGITTDYCFAESVLEFRLARITTKGKVSTLVCHPSDSSKQRMEDFSHNIENKNKNKNQNHKLFSLALGGYGLFGVMTEVVLKVENNVHLELDTMQLSVQPSDGMHEEISSSEFVRIFDNARDVRGDCGENESLQIGKVGLKLARLNIINLKKASFYVFRYNNASTSSTISDLPAEPRKLSQSSRLLYKWAMPLLKDLRYSMEERSGKALDFDGAGSTRNELLFESAVPLSQLYNPLVTKDDTFVLQEFFCPHDKFSQWIDEVKPIFKDIEKQQKQYNHDLILLNTTIRYVEEDDITFLKYSRVPGGVFAFVLYYRIKRDEVVEKRLGDFHNRFARVTVDLGGTFYLPYRKCYSPELLKAAYPMIEVFAQQKEAFDPDCMFANLWFEHYVLPFCSQGYKEKYLLVNTTKGNEENLQGFNLLDPMSSAKCDTQKVILTEKEFWEWLPRKNEQNTLRRSNSYRELLRSKELRDQFRRQFLVQIFNLADPDQVMQVMTRAAWDPANKTDLHIYKIMHNYFHGSDEADGIDLTLIPQFWRGLLQLRNQKNELMRETLSIVSKLGKLGSIKNYVSMGDNGKTIKVFTQEMNITGKLWLVHDNVSPNDAMHSIGAVLERGSLDRVTHEELKYDYTCDKASEKLSKIPSRSIDLVTMNQGLHHIPLTKLFGFLSEVRRILCADGIFIIREHDLKLPASSVNSSSINEHIREGGRYGGKIPYPMLDLAHSVFNAVTGVPIKDEREEIRAFRPILEWRVVLEKLGFVDSLVYDIEDGDPTWDVMMAFSVTTNNQDISYPVQEKTSVHEIHSDLTRREDTEPPIIKLVHTLLSQVPSFTTSNAADMLQFIERQLPWIQNKILDLILIAIPYLLAESNMFGSESRSIAKKIADTLEPQVRVLFDQIINFVEGSLSLLSQSQLNEKFNFRNLGEIPELFLILPYIERKVQLEADKANYMEKTLVSLLHQYLPALLPKNELSVKNEMSVAQDDNIRSESQSIVNESDNEITVVNGSEIEDFIEGLTGRLPGLSNPDIVMVQSGFTITQQASIIGQFGGHDFESGCKNFATYLDRKIWTKLKVKLSAAVSSGDLPTRSRLLSVKDNHPWRSVLKLFLQSPKVKLIQQTIFGLRMIGLGEIVTLYNEAKIEYKAEESTNPMDDQYENSILSQLSSFNSSLQMLAEDEVVQRTIKYGNKKDAENNLWDVAEVIEAKFGYNSITSRMVNVTKEMKLIYNSIHSGLPSPSYNLSIPGNVQVGWLPINEHLLVEMRNKGNKRNELGDSFRKNLVNVATLGVAGKNQLIIKYRRTSNNTKSSGCEDMNIYKKLSTANSVKDVGKFKNIKQLSEDLCNFLETNDLICADLHPKDGLYTWFKLSEWMQVEILDELVKSLDHTPWFRFPFMKFLTTYFTVLKEQCGIVQEKYGFIAAYGSMAFFTDFIPGVVMSFLFGQLQLLAIPLKLAIPKGYSVDDSRFMEEIVLQIPMNGCNYDENWETFFRSKIDERILNLKMLPNNFMVLSTPTFKAMGEILQKIALRFSTARIFQISNQKEVQVRISLDARRLDSNYGLLDNDLDTILAVPGVVRMMDYQYPNTHKSNGDKEEDNGKRVKTYYCLQVHCLALLDVYRMCGSLEHYKVEQVYDFWN